MARTKRRLTTGSHSAFSAVSERALARHAPALRRLTRRIAALLKREGLIGGVNAHVTVLVREPGARWPQGGGGINAQLQF